LLLAATVRSFAHMPLGISDRNTVQKEYANREADILQENIAEDHKTNKMQFRMLKG